MFFERHSLELGTPIKKLSKFAIPGDLVVVAALSIAFFALRANRRGDIAAGQRVASLEVKSSDFTEGMSEIITNQKSVR